MKDRPQAVSEWVSVLALLRLNPPPYSMKVPEHTSVQETI